MQSHPLDPLIRLDRTLADRAASRPTGSYTTRLLDGGVEAIAAKIREEAEETIEAAGQTGADLTDEQRQHFVYECGDLVYHLMTLMAYRGVTVDELAGELARREGTSGLQEKASRSTS